MHNYKILKEYQCNKGYLNLEIELEGKVVFFKRSPYIPSSKIPNSIKKEINLYLENDSNNR